MSNKKYINRDVLESGLRSGAALASLVNRGTGRTTADVLIAIGQAIENHGEPVVIHRHGGESCEVGAARSRQDLARRVIAALNLQRMEAELKHSASGYYVTVTSKFAEAI